MSKQRRIMAIASSGGHWNQLRRLAPAFPQGETTWVTTSEGHRGEVGRARFFVVPDSNRWNKVALAKSAASVLLTVIRVRPTHLVTTGAAPGFFALFFTRCLGGRTIWIDSIANAEELSMSGQKARRWASEVWTQWPELECAAEGRLGKVVHRGAVL